MVIGMDQDLCWDDRAANKKTSRGIEFLFFIRLRYYKWFEKANN